MEDFGSYIKAEREKKGLSQHELATGTGLARSTLGAIETGAIKKVDPDTFNRLQEALDFDPLTALWRQGYRVPQPSGKVGPAIDPDLIQLLERFGPTEQALIANIVRTIARMVGIRPPARRVQRARRKKDEDEKPTRENQ